MDNLLCGTTGVAAEQYASVLSLGDVQGVSLVIVSRAAGCPAGAVLTDVLEAFEDALDGRVHGLCPLLPNNRTSTANQLFDVTPSESHHRLAAAAP